MKKILAIVLLSALGTGYVSAFHDKEEGFRKFTGKGIHELANRKAEKIADFAQRLTGYEIKVKPEAIKAMHELWADKARLHAKMALECARTSEDQVTSQQYKDVAGTLLKLSQQLRDIEVPDQPVTKSFKYALECLKLKAETKRMASKLWHHVYKQTGDKFARYLSKRTKMMAHVLGQAAELAENSD